MSFFQKILFKTFLFLALICFFSSSAFATTYTYYKAGGVCSFSKEKFCADDLKSKQIPYGSNPTVDISQISCTADNNYVTLNWQFARKNSVDGSLYEIDSQRYSTSAQVMRAECDKQFTLNADCSTSCELDPCAAKAGQKETRTMQCGLAQGTNCAFKQTPDSGDESTYWCENYAISWAELVGTKTSLGGCEGVVTSQKPLIKNNGNYEINGVYNGQGAVPINCEVEITYSGQQYQEDSTPPPPTQPKDSSTGGSQPPSGQVGTGGLNPPTQGGSGGDGRTCTITGQTKVNGTCQCPVNQTVQNGACTVNGSGDGSGSGNGSGSGSGGGSGAGSGGGYGSGTGVTCDSTLCGEVSDFEVPEPPDEPESWWESEYEDGLEGIWQEKQQHLKDTALINWFKSGVNLPASGQCPSFSIPLGQFGTQTFDIPCYVFDFVRACILFTALMLCRRIIFGG